MLIGAHYRGWAAKVGVVIPVAMVGGEVRDNTGLQAHELVGCQ